MATIKVKKHTTNDTAPSNLSHGEIGATQNLLWYGNSSGTNIRIARHSELSNYLPLTGGTLTNSNTPLVLDSGGSPNITFHLGGTGTTGDYKIQSWGSSRHLSLEGMGDVSINIDHNNNQTNKKFTVRHNGEGSNGTVLFEVNEAGGVLAGGQALVKTNDSRLSTDLGSSGTGATRTITSSTGSNTSITYSAGDIGAAPTSHNHNADDIDAGVLSYERRMTEIIGFANIVDNTTPYGQVVIVLCPYTPNASHNISGRIYTQRSSGNRQLTMVDFGYSSASNTSPSPDYYLEYVTGAQATLTPINWSFVTFDYQGTTWVGLYFDGARYTISKAFFDGINYYSGVNSLKPLHTSNITNFDDLDPQTWARRTFLNTPRVGTNNIVLDNDSALTDARTPLAHNQAYTTINNVPTGGVLGRNTSGTGSTEHLSYANLKSYLSLENVTNESKATMFSSAALTGTPTAPTATAATNTTQIATTAYVKSQGYVTSSGVTSVGGTSPIASSGGTTPTISVASGFTIPTSTEKGNYDTAFTHAGTTTGSIHGSSTVGTLLFRIADNATNIKFIRVNANNTIEYRAASQVRSDIGAGTVTSVGGTGTVSGITLSGSINSSGNLTLGGTLSTPVSSINDSTTVGQNLVKLPNPGAVRFIRINSNNTISALSDTLFRVAIGAPAETAVILYSGSAQISGRFTSSESEPTSSGNFITYNGVLGASTVFGRRMLDIGTGTGIMTITNFTGSNFVRARNSSGTRVIRIPLDETFPIGVEYNIFREGAGDVEIESEAGGTGARHIFTEGYTGTLNSGKRKINERYQAVTLKKITATRWVLIGAVKE